jgi:hypothetical protein
VVGRRAGAQVPEWRAMGGRREPKRDERVCAVTRSRSDDADVSRRARTRGAQNQLQGRVEPPRTGLTPPGVTRRLDIDPAGNITSMQSSVLMDIVLLSGVTCPIVVT